MSSLPSPTTAPARSASTVLDLIGRTALVRLPHFEREIPGVELYAKAEWQNPGGSVKDRAAFRMITDGEASGKLRPGLIIVDATSGNRALVEESEKRQQRELALRIAELLRDVNAQRQADLVKIDRTLGVVQNNVGIEVMKNRQQINQMDLLYRASQRQ